MASYSLNEPGVAHARKLIDARQYVLDSDWGDVQPRAEQENEFLASHSWDDYAKWHLGLTEGAADETKARYAFVYGDLRRLHRSGLIACTTGPRSGGTRRSSWPPTTCSSTSTERARSAGARPGTGRRARPWPLGQQPGDLHLAYALGRPATRPGPAAGELRRLGHEQLVDQVGVDQLPVQVGTALAEQRPDAELVAQALEECGEIEPALLAQHIDRGL